MARRRGSGSGRRSKSQGGQGNGGSRGRGPSRRSGSQQRPVAPSSHSGGRRSFREAASEDRGRPGGPDHQDRSDRRPDSRGRRHQQAHRETDEAPGPRHDLSKARETTAARLSAWLKPVTAAPTQAPDPVTGLVLDPWQQETFDALGEGCSVVVDAPTTAGKTRAVEAFFHANLHRSGFRACYTTPVKSLSNDKLREFREMFGADNVGIATGDIKDNLNAPIVVATLESYRNSLLGVEPDLGRNLVVFDEYHYLQDESRGSAWEEAIILTPPSCQILMLSASVANAEEFRDWLSSLSGDRRSRLVRTETRPVPLEHLVYWGSEWLLPDTLPANALRQLDREKLEIPLRQEDLAARLVKILPLGLSPCIVYAGRRMACETMAMYLTRVVPELSAEESERISAALTRAQEEFRGLSFLGQKLRHMIQVHGVAWHHSGLAAPARMTVEMLVKGGLLRFCTATMGLSLGINFSVRSALISDYVRPGESGFTAYAPSEVLQMLGRAGRRGRDQVGFSLWPTVESYHKMAGARREPVSSRLKNDPTTFLGLVGRGFSLRAVEHFYGRSFMKYKDSNIDLTLITKSRIAKKLAPAVLPCDSPAAEAARAWTDNPESRCHDCSLQSRCHTILEAKSSAQLTALHLHLHKINALDRTESLTRFGNVARYLPQSGGLVLARMLADGEIHADNIHAAAQLAGAMTLARFKEPHGDSRYRLPFDAELVEEEIESLYPYELFPEIWDPPYGRRPYPVIREWNPAAGYIIREWINGRPWKDLIAEVTHDLYGMGDVMALIYRVATYMQSISQAGLGPVSEMSRTLRDVLLREPLTLALSL